MRPRRAGTKTSMAYLVSLSLVFLYGAFLAAARYCVRTLSLARDPILTRLNVGGKDNRRARRMTRLTRAGQCNWRQVYCSIASFYFLLPIPENSGNMADWNPGRNEAYASWRPIPQAATFHQQRAIWRRSQESVLPSSGQIVLPLSWFQLCQFLRLGAHVNSGQRGSSNAAQAAGPGCR